jgi:photosystem II stability/assembly factor-like uncharacterized protein
MKKHLLIILNIALMLLTGMPDLKAQHIELLEQGKPTSIRGLSVVDDKVAWVSGSKGYVAMTTNSGKTWDWQQVKGFEKADFRDIEAFSDKEAIIMSSGTPALILKTIDGGANWQVKYRNADTAYFLDAMDFDDQKHGYVLGDPIKSKFVLLETKNGGESWLPFTNPPIALPGEAAFAASGTCLRVLPNGNMFIATGGTSAEIDMPKANGGWDHHKVPILNGQSAQGAFSVAVSTQQLVVVGGDYQHDKRNDSTVCYSIDGGHIWQLAKTQPSGYQSCVENINGAAFLSTGTPGSNITIDNGKTWAKIGDTSYNVCRKAKNGTLFLLAGDRGKIGILKL